ncbi:MAG: choice-of-anchor J domain-containing protein [Prevotella histicola]|uniref:choice-of-anchor J domain-containing protein n=1 Tax=Prevotella histicola TaxID=470565 RepID=UPI00241EF607|nr:choice-of-anchor J domain-containing protein [Prevotella histicola]MBS5897328.1 choice-of-anchor J domain-containing protein [Prevotella histicola]
MKKIIYSMMALAFSASVFTSCEDVPAPYNMTFEDSNVTPTPQPTTDLNTEATAWTVAEAVQKIQAGQTSNGEAYVKGVISAVTFYDANHKSITYYLSDNGTDQTLQVYSGKGLDGADFVAKTDLQVGQTVVVKGNLKSFTNKQGQTIMEIDRSSKIITINNSVNPTPQPTTDLNTEATAWTTTEAVQKIQAGQTSNGEAYVKGVISAVTFYDANHKSITYYLSDNGTDKTLQVFSGKGVDGADFTAKTDLQVGQTVVVKGNLKSFTNKQGQTIMEMDKGSKIITINNSVTPTPQPTTSALEAKFDTGMDNFTINNITIPSDLTFVWKHDANKKYMKASSFKSNVNYAAQSRLESPTFSLTGRTSATLTFQVAANYFTTAADNFKVQVSTNGTTWHDVPVSTYPAKDWKFVTSTCDLSAYAGQSNVRIGFLYTCDGTNAAGTWEIKNIEVK